MELLMLLLLVIVVAFLFAVNRETRLNDTETEDCAFAGHCISSSPCADDLFHDGVCCICGGLITEGKELI
jgi:hypothetical protein